VEGACCGAASVSDKSPGARGSEIACLEVPPDESVRRYGSSPLRHRAGFGEGETPSLRSECQRDQPAKGADPTEHPHQIAYAKSPQGGGREKRPSQTRAQSLARHEAARKPRRPNSSIRTL